eukprot:NODE_122_length_18870_cov_0.236908.p5 type:complete len:345 gc:universal NODE_122_length_18870_cov_0.236908:15268-14234(-)
MLTWSCIFMLNHVIAISVDCPNVVDLARTLGMKGTAPDQFADIQVDCCHGFGVTCDKERVIEIVWYSIYLNGTLSNNYIPSNLIGLYLENNRIQGKIPTKLPLTLKYFDVSNNEISGTIPAELPPNLVYFDVSANKVTGSIPPTLPKTLSTLSLWSNFINGTIPDPLPPNLIELFLNNNKMFGDVPKLPESLTSLNLGYPRQIAGLKPHFTGTVELFAPTDVRINNNYITNIIVHDASALKQCDLSQNPLLGNPNVEYLRMCITSGLYDASTLPRTMIDALPTDLPDEDSTVVVVLDYTILIVVLALAAGGAYFIYKRKKQDHLQLEAFVFREGNTSREFLNSK